MKRTTIFLLSICIFFTANADENKYIESMKKTIEALYSAQTPEELQKAVNTMERIGSAEKGKWEPHYYAAYGYIMISIHTADAGKKDVYLDQAMKAIGDAKTLAPKESEIMALHGFAQMMRLAIDPASRGAQYSQLAYDAFGKALEANPENPRALALLAQMQLGTAKFFGSSTEESCRTLAKALDKFSSYKADNILAPRWGIQMAESMKNACK